MIRDFEKWHRWEAEMQRKSEANIEENFKILETLINQVKLLNRWPAENPLEGIEVDIKIAKVVNEYVEKHPR